MSSTAVNVLRWSALAFGVFYGFSHQRTITATQRTQHAKHEYEHKQKLIEKAKAEFAKQKSPAIAAADDGTLIRKKCGIAPLIRGGHISTPRGDMPDLICKLTIEKADLDVNSPSFDLEKFLIKVSKENP